MASWGGTILPTYADNEKFTRPALGDQIRINARIGTGDEKHLRILPGGNAVKEFLFLPEKTIRENDAGLVKFIHGLRSLINACASRHGRTPRQCLRADQKQKAHSTIHAVRSNGRPAGTEYQPFGLSFLYNAIMFFISSAAA